MPVRSAIRHFPEDFERFDLILAMDRKNQSQIEALRPEGNCTPVRLFLDFAGPDYPKDIPDPWFESTFGAVYGLIEKAAGGLLRTL